MLVRSKHLMVMLAVAVVLLLRPAIAVAQASGQIKIGTGGPAGVYFVAGNAICRMVRDAKRPNRTAGLRCAAPPSGGSIDNLEKLRRRDIDFAIVQSDWHYHVFNGTSRFKGKANPNLRSVFSLHVEPFQIVVASGSGIRSWRDLDGKRVNIGNIGSGHRATFEELVRAHGQSLSRFRSVSGFGSSEQATALCGGRIDAFAFTVGVPNASIAQATDGCEGSIINLQTKEVGELIKKSRYYRWTVIPEGTYFTSVSNVTTLGVTATLMTRADVDAATVEYVVTSVMENLRRFRRLHPAFAELKVEEMAKIGLFAPLHPGARGYLAKRGLVKQ